MKILQTNKILVTGAGGFIGSHLTEELVRQGYNVRAFIYYNSFNSWEWLDKSSPEIKDKVEIFFGDIRDPYRVKEAVQGCDIVFHLASLVAIPYSYQSPDSYVDTNIKGTLNVLQAARELQIEKLIHISTSEVYGTAKFVPIREDHPLQGQSPYSATKIAAEQLAMAFYYSFNTPVSIVRPFNTYGPRQSARAIIPAVIMQIAAGAREIALGALHPTRDFSYIKDTVNGLIAVAVSSHSVGQIINLGSNYEISISDVVQLIAEVMEVKIRIKTGQERLRPAKSEVNQLLADNSKAKKILPWRPDYAGHSGLRKGLQETANWFSDRENLRFYKVDIYNT